MSDEVTMNVDTQGLEEALKSLPDKITRQCLHKALQAGGDIMQAAIVTLAPERTDEEDLPERTDEDNSSGALPPGLLKADIQTQLLSRAKGGARLKIGATMIASRTLKWQDQGWALTSHSKKLIRQIAGKHFMVGGFDQSVSAALDRFVEVLGTEVAAAVAADAKKGT